MPSFIIHSIAGQKLCNELNFNSDEKNNFFIGNLLPDSTNIERDSNWSEIKLRQIITKEKKITHFKTNTGTLEYPDITFFLGKYENECKKNVATLGYLFHLYTDYYYFKYFLSKTITFLTKDKKITNIKSDIVFVRINKNNKELKDEDFWSKIKEIGLYQEYTRLNKYLMEKYYFNCECDDMLKFLDENNFETNIKEINPNNGKQVLNKLKKLIYETNKCIDKKLQIFEKSKIDCFIDDVFENFINEYDYLLENYQNKY